MRGVVKWLVCLLLLAAEGVIFYFIIKYFGMRIGG